MARGGARTSLEREATERLRSCSAESLAPELFAMDADGAAIGSAQRAVESLAPDTPRLIEFGVEGACAPMRTLRIQTQQP